MTFEIRVRLCDIDGMYTIPIAPEKWQKLYGFLRAHPRVYAGNEENCRRFIVAVYWILRTGAQWRALPERFGKWNSVYRRFARWEDRGILAELHDYFVCDPDMTAVMLDSTVVRAHMCAVGGSKRGGSQKAQALGRSRGGFSSKIHIVVDAVGFPLRFSLTGGERHDITQAESLLAPFHFDAFIGDKGYDSDHLRDLLETNQVEVVVPSRRHRKQQRDYDKLRYKERNIVERFINKIKWYRRIFTRYEKLACRYIAFVHLAATVIWLD